MGRRRKSKGIVIELTALLDVILIMLFWVLLNVKGESAEWKTEADAKIQSLEQQLKTNRKETDKEIEKAWEMAKNINSEAADNQKALYDYEQGLPLVLQLTYQEDGKAAVIIRSQGHERETLWLSGEEKLSDQLIGTLEKSGIDRKEVILCALLYDGNVALYRDVNTVKQAVEQVTQVYTKCYCTNINLIQ